VNDEKMSHEISCAVVPAPFCEWSKCKNQVND